MRERVSESLLFCAKERNKGSISLTSKAFVDSFLVDIGDFHQTTKRLGVVIVLYFLLYLSSWAYLIDLVDVKSP